MTKLSDIKNREDFGLLLNGLGLLGEGAEIGVFHGSFSQMILNQWNGAKLWLVDAWQNQPEAEYDDGLNRMYDLSEGYEITKSRVKSYRDRVGLIRKFSVEAAQDFKDWALDFAYIDANHSYDAVKADIEAWWPKVKPGGLLCGHDYGMGPGLHDVSKLEKGLVTAVLEFAIHNSLSIHGDRDSWYIQKPL